MVTPTDHNTVFNSSTMASEFKSARKRAYPDENIDTSTPATPRKRRATGSNRSPGVVTSTNTSPDNTPGSPHIVRSPYFSPPRKAKDNARKKRLLAASSGLMNENSRFIKRPPGVPSPAEPVKIRGRVQRNVVETTTSITEHLVSELSKSKSRKRRARRDHESVALEETDELAADKASLSAFEKQVRVCVNLARVLPWTRQNRYQA